MSEHQDSIIDYKENIQLNEINKAQYGEVITPMVLVNEMFDFLPQEAFEDPYLKWLDPGCGTGHFCIELYKRLNNGLKTKIKDEKERKHQIITDMITMVDLNKEHVEHCRKIFGENANVFHNDFTTFVPKYSDKNKMPTKYDFIIGNPPYNSGGLKKTPTNQMSNKKEDGRTIWIDFVKQSLILLKENGYLLFIIPSIWMKPDKANMFQFMILHNLVKIKCYSNTMTKSIFKGQAQTPTCIVLLQKAKSKRSVELWDNGKFIKYPLQSPLVPKNLLLPIPLCGSNIIRKLLLFIDKHGNLSSIVRKSNMPGKNNNLKKGPLSKMEREKYCFNNIATTKISQGTIPELEIQYSTQECAFAGKPKLVLAHKMYGFPYYDETGSYGISNRDNYIILEDDIIIDERKRELGYTKNKLMKLLGRFLSNKTILFIYETTRYRMKYLEKYAFQLIPNILLMNKIIEDFSHNDLEKLDDNYIYSLFDLDNTDIESIENHTKKNYQWFM